MLKIWGKNVEKCRGKTNKDQSWYFLIKKGSILVLSWLILSCLIFVTVQLKNQLALSKFIMKFSVSNQNYISHSTCYWKVIVKKFWRPISEISQQKFQFDANVFSPIRTYKFFGYVGSNPHSNPLLGALSRISSLMLSTIGCEKGRVTT